MIAMSDRWIAEIIVQGKVSQTFLASVLNLQLAVSDLLITKTALEEEIGVALSTRVVFLSGAIGESQIAVTIKLEISCNADIAQFKLVVDIAVGNQS